jgi:hypothetical protein
VTLEESRARDGVAVEVAASTHTGGRELEGGESHGNRKTLLGLRRRAQRLQEKKRLEEMVVPPPMG